MKKNKFLCIFLYEKKHREIHEGISFAPKFLERKNIYAKLFKGKLVSNALRFILRRGIGGIVPGSGSNDTVPAMLTPGEVVISKPAAQKFGISNLLAINAAAGAKSKPIIKNKTIFAITF